MAKISLLDSISREHKYDKHTSIDFSFGGLDVSDTGSICGIPPSSEARLQARIELALSFSIAFSKEMPSASSLEVGSISSALITEG